MPEVLGSRTATADALPVSCWAERPKTQRSATTNDPIATRANKSTTSGRRIRDLFYAFLEAMGGPTDTILQANALTAAELTVACETARAALLAGAGDIEQVIRLENLGARAVRRLGLRSGAKPASPPSVHEYLAARATRAADAPALAPAFGSPSAGETRHAPPQNDGEAS